MVVLEGMLRTLILPVVINCNGAISSCENADSNTLSLSGNGVEWEMALGILDNVVCRSLLRPDAVSFGSAITSSEKGENWEASLGLLLDMR